MNKVILAGYVGKDPEVRRMESGAACAKFSLATNKSYRNGSGERETKTEWHNLIAWRQRAELCESYVRKGMWLMIEGELETYHYTDHENKKRYTTQIIIEKIEFGPRNQQPQQGGLQPVTPKNAVIEEDGDDLPF